MKKGVILFAALFLISAFVCAQTIENLEFISPFNDGVSAIKKDNTWGFINNDGDIVIDFRNDLVSTKFKDEEYPIFKSDRCIIKKVDNGISYFGYIDSSGKTVIEPEYLNATNFIDDEAIALKLMKESIGKNDILDKNIIYYRYYVVTIDVNGKVNQYLTPKGFNVVLDKKHLRTPPKITTKRISNNLYALLNKNKTWTIISTKE